MKRILGILFGLAISIGALAQTPTGFSYQAALRDADGKILSNQSAQLRVSLMGSDETTQHYREVHTVTTNQLGLINIIIGKGTNAEGNFDQVPWADDAITMKIEIKLAGASEFIAMGTEPLLPVPYAFHAGSVKEIISIESDPDEEPIFSVKNKNGEVVFAVFQDGVEINIEEEDGKSRKAGFAIGGLSRSKDGDTEEYFRVLPHSTQINLVVDEDGGKSRKAGFAIGGLSRSKDGDDPNYFIVSPDSTRIFLDEDGGKSRKAGFAIGGLSRSKSGDNIYFEVDKDSTIVKNTTYIKEDLVVEGNITEEGKDIGGGKFGVVLHDKQNKKPYRTVKLGEQTWMAENLSISYYYDNTTLEEYTWGSFPEHEPHYEHIFGLAYSFDEITDPVNICPVGWRIPTDKDWLQLFDFLVPGFDINDDAKKKDLFEQITMHYASFLWADNSFGLNTSGLELTPGGNSIFSDWQMVQSGAFFWAQRTDDSQLPFYVLELTTEYDQSGEEFEPVINLSDFSLGDTLLEEMANHVRCIKD